MDAPTRIGKYELLQFLGGGMSHVYRATDTVLRRTVAVKILTEQGTADREAKARFLQEAITAGNIQHENIIKVYDYGEENGRPFIVMEFLVGEDLRDAIRNHHTGDVQNRVRIALSVARALEHVHSKKIIHRDIKPENIHIDTNGHVRLMDFGIAKSEGFSMTKTGFALGTPYYMAPEQVLGHPATERVDIYAFGVLLYELMTGIKPYTGDSVERLFFMILNEPLNADCLRDNNIPPPLCDLITRCTAKKPDERPQEFAAVIRDLERLKTLQTSAESATMPVRTGPIAVAAAPVPPSPAPPAVVAPPVPVPAAPPPATSPKLGLIAAAGAVVLIGGAIGLYYFMRPGAGTATVDPKQQQQQSQPTQPTDPPKALASTITTETSEMVLVPAGKFVFGDKATRNSAETGLPAFYIDRTEVSNAAWADFARATGRPAPKGDPELPVVNVTLADARAFATWAGKRLPTAQEWEKAARGTDGRKFPWGSEPDPKRANVDTRRIEKVNTRPESASPFGALHMAGNVWEFVDGAITPSTAAVEGWAGRLKPRPTADEPWCSVKGGSFENPLDFAILYEWLPAPERVKGPDIGFRCVKDPPR